jgi:hypothetical protein
MWTGFRGLIQNLGASSILVLCPNQKEKSAFSRQDHFGEHH